MTPPDALDWAIYLASLVLWSVLVYLWYGYQARKRQQWLQVMKENDDQFFSGLRELDATAASVDRDLAYYHLYRILTNEDDDQVYYDAAAFLKERTFFSAEKDDANEADTTYTARELMALSREQRAAILKKGVDKAAGMGLYSEEWFANEEVPSTEEEEDEGGWVTNQDGIQVNLGAFMTYEVEDLTNDDAKE